MMWPFKPKPTQLYPTGFVDDDGIYKIRLDPKKFKTDDLTWAVLCLLDRQEERNGRTPKYVERHKCLEECVRKGEPVPAKWLDSTIGTIRSDSNGLPAKYPIWENRG